MDSQIANFWEAFLATQDDPSAAQSRFLEAFQIGGNAESANNGADLVLRGIKTTTSSLLWEYEDSEPPTVGALSILKDGQGNPVCVVETIKIEIKPFSEVDEAFAYEYGEWDRTLATWQEKNYAYYTAYCAVLGREASAEMPLVCEWMRVIYA